MTNLKELRNKIAVIQSTRKVTAAMKLVAGVKLKKAEQKAVSSREYAKEIKKMLTKLHPKFLDIENQLFIGRKNVKTELLIVFASDKGLCGNYNYLIKKFTEQKIASLHENGKKIRLMCIGTKLVNLLKVFLNENDFLEPISDFYNNETMFTNANDISQKVIDAFYAEQIDKVSIICTKYFSAIRHEVNCEIVIPIVHEKSKEQTTTIFEPNISDVLNDLLPYNVAIQIYQLALESIASEQSSRMISMDNATRNADELLSDLVIKLNRMRQFGITQELVEVVSGAEAIVKG